MNVALDRPSPVKSNQNSLLTSADQLNISTAISSLPPTPMQMRIPQSPARLTQPTPSQPQMASQTPHPVPSPVPAVQKCPMPQMPVPNFSYDDEERLSIDESTAETAPPHHYTAPATPQSPPRQNETVFLRTVNAVYHG